MMAFFLKVSEYGSLIFVARALSQKLYFHIYLLIDRQIQRPNDTQVRGLLVEYKAHVGDLTLCILHGGLSSKGLKL